MEQEERPVPKQPKQVWGQVSIDITIHVYIYVTCMYTDCFHCFRSFLNVRPIELRRGIPASPHPFSPLPKNGMRGQASASSPAGVASFVMRPTKLLLVVLVVAPLLAVLTGTAAAQGEFVHVVQERTCLLESSHGDLFSQRASGPPSLPPSFPPSLRFISDHHVWHVRLKRNASYQHQGHVRASGTDTWAE